MEGKVIYIQTNLRVGMDVEWDISPLYVLVYSS